MTDERIIHDEEIEEFPRSIICDEGDVYAGLFEDSCKGDVYATREFEYVGPPQKTRGDHGVAIKGAHTRRDDPSNLYVHDPDFGDMFIGAVAKAEELGFEEIE